ncbi:MAG: helix-turn-helix transcriptional regulator [Lachnospiraceae bacterium]|nr:helix-turn-helix transcriptional regulator [Lachnospiraceae bacterium]
MKKNLGAMINEVIIKQNISQRTLCVGLCSTTAFSRYVNGDRHMDRLLLSAILQRLGISADKFVTLLSEKEYIYFEWRQKVCVAQLHRDWSMVEALLLEKEAFDRTCNEKLQEQFYLIMKAIVEEKQHQNCEKSVELLEKAILLTVPTFKNGISRYTLLGAQEISAILLWQRLQPDKEVAMKILRQMVNYIEIHFEDLQEKSKVYPKVVGQYLPLLFEKGKYAECLWLAKKTIEIMTSTGFVMGLENILGTYVDVAEKMGLEEETRKFRVQLQAWRELMNDTAMSMEEVDDGLYQLDVSQEIVLLNEMIYRNRCEKGYTQEELSEDVCEPESLSRIETGKQNPNHRTYKAIAQKLSLPQERYFSAIETDDFEVLDARWELELLIIKGDYADANKKLEQLRRALDLSLVQNLQYIEEVRFVIEQKTNKIPLEEQFSILMNVLNLTIQKVPNSDHVEEWTEEFWMHSFSEREMSILIQVVDVLRCKNKHDSAVCLLKEMLAYYQKSKVQIEFHYRIVILILQRLSTCCGQLKQHDEELFYSEMGIRISMESGNRKSLPLFLNNKADALENLKNKKTSLQYYKLAFYISELLQTNTARIAKRSYETLTGTDEEWY